MTYFDGTKYHCERDLLQPLVGQGQYAEDECGSCLSSHVFEHGHEPFSLVARSLSGQEYCLPNVTAMLTLWELKQRIAKQVNGALPTVGWTGVSACIAGKLQLAVGERTLQGDKQFLEELGITGSGVVVSFVKRAVDKRAKNLLVRDLLVAISTYRVHEARSLVNDLVDANGTAHLVHTLKAAYLGGQTEITSFLLEQCPSEVLFQFLSMTTRPGYRPYHTIFRWINRESILQHMVMTNEHTFLETIYRKLSGRWMSKLQLVELRFRSELAAEADLVCYRAGVGCLESWANGRSTNPEYILQKLRVPSVSSTNCVANSFEDDFMIGARDTPNTKRRSGRSFIQNKIASKTAIAKCSIARSRLPSPLRPPKFKKLGRVQVAMDRRRKWSDCE